MELKFKDDNIEKEVIDIKGYPTGWPYDKEKDIKILNLQYT